MASMPETVINVVTLEGVKLNLSEGDMLAVMVPEKISAERRLLMHAAVERALPDGVKAIIFDGGITVSAISAKKADPVISNPA